MPIAMQDIASLKVTDLKAELKKRGLAVGGLKKELIERLQKALDTERQSEEPEPEEEELEEQDEDAVVEEAREDTPPPEASVTSESQPEQQIQSNEPMPEKQSASESSEQPGSVQEQIPVIADLAHPESTIAVAEPIAGEEIKATPQPAKSPPIEAIDPEMATTKEAIMEQQEIRAEPAHDENKIEEEAVTLQSKEENKPKLENDSKKKVPAIAEGVNGDAMEVDTEIDQSKDTENKLAETENNKIFDTEPQQAITKETTSVKKLEQDLSESITAQESTSIVVPVIDVDVMDTSPDIATDARKRKRRSVSPEPSTTLSTQEGPSPKKARQEEQDILDSRRRESVNASKPDIRFKSLTASTGNVASMEGIDDDEDIQTIPAIHPATTAIYIRDLMRPIKPYALREHLVSLATKNNTEIPETGDVIRTFYLDSLKTHAFVVFETVNYATRARAGLAGKKFPVNEKGRKPLWVDFVPGEMVSEWIAREDKASSSMVKWHVSYDTLTTEDGGSEVRAYHGEVGGSNGAPIASTARKLEMRISTRDGGTASTTIVTTADAPAVEVIDNSGHRNSNGKNSSASPIVTRLPPDMPKKDREEMELRERTRNNLNSETNKTFKTIDQLFLSTRAKPKLYYLPVSETIANQRLEEFKEKERIGGKDGPDPRERPGAPQWGGRGPPKRGGGGGWRGGPREIKADEWRAGGRGSGGRRGTDEGVGRRVRSVSRDRSRSRSPARGGRRR